MSKTVKAVTHGVEVGGKLTLSASVGPISRKDMSPDIGGLTNFDVNNRFTYYQQLSTCSPHVSIPLNKLGLSLVKGAKFQGKSRDVKEFEDWSERVNFIEQIQTVARLLCRDGIYLATFNPNPDNFQLYPSLMSYMTILPDGVLPGDTPNTIMQPQPKLFVSYEGEAQQSTITPEEVIYGTYNAWDSVQYDVKKRKTFGLYGASLLESIELSIRNLLNINEGYVSFVHRYGLGRFHYDHKMLQKLVETGIISIDKASEIHKQWLEDNKNLSENEDISAIGLDVVPLDAAGSLDVQAFKESLETDIQVGLLQSPITMGKSEGSTYAAGYVSEADRMLVLEGLQKIVRSIVNKAISKRLILQGKKSDAVKISFAELSIPEMTPDFLLELCNTGHITEEELRERAGFPPKKPESQSETQPEPLTVNQANPVKQTKTQPATPAPAPN